MIKHKFEFFRGNEAEQFNFYRIPKILFTDKRFSKVSVEAKVLYGLMLDRISLSVKNNWVDDDDRVYIYFKLEEAMEMLNIGKDKGVKLFAELDSEKGCGLIQKRRQGLGKPTIIYVMKFSSFINENEVDISEESTSENGDCGLPKNRIQNVGKTEANNTEFNNININNTECINPIISSSKVELGKRQKYKELICQNINYEILLDTYSAEQLDGLIDIMLDAICCSNEYITVCGNIFPQEVVKSRMLKLRYEHMEYVLDCMRETTSNIKNIKSYLLTALYNAPTTIDHYYTAKANHNLYGGTQG